MGQIYRSIGGYVHVRKLSAGHLYYGGKDNYIITHEKGNVHVWYDYDARWASYSQHKEDNEDDSGFDIDIATSDSIQAHIDEGIATLTVLVLSRRVA